MKIVFMGTPDFAVSTLESLLKGGHEVIAAVTQPDKPKGRKMILTPPPVKVCAEEHGIPVYQPKTLRGEEFAALLQEIAPELIVVAAYGKILPENVINYPSVGCICVHGSLLPKYRGAAPMQRAIIDGKEKTGITLMYMAEGLDTGDMLLKEEVAIEENDNFEDIHDKLGKCGAQLIVKTLDLLETEGIERIPQDDSLSNYAAKIEKADCLIDFSKSAEVVHNQIRGLSPVPVSFTKTPDGKLLKILETRIFDEEKRLYLPAPDDVYVDELAARLKKLAAAKGE